MVKITSLHAREILDSRGKPTVEVLCMLSNGAHATASVPSGASTGAHEALELRDRDTKRYNGLGVLKAIEHVNTVIAHVLVGKAWTQKTLDHTLIALDGTSNKTKLGANAMLGVSLAFARATAYGQCIPLYEYLGNLVGNKVFTLPQPMFNVINGGKHADSGLDIQECMLAPIGFKTIKEKIRVGAEIITALRALLVAEGYATSVGDEGGFAPRLSSNEEAFDLLVEAIKKAGYATTQVKIGIDVAATSFYKNHVYELKIGGAVKRLPSPALIEWYEKLVKKYPILFIEDGLSEDDWDGFCIMRKRLGDAIGIVGDDLLVTNTTRIQKAFQLQAVNAVLIKPNQIGTLTETIDAIVMTKAQKHIPFVSHRSGETTDTFIADLAVGLSCEYIKSGSLARGERVCKYNRLMEIEEKLARKK